MKLVERVWHRWEKWECVKAGMYDTASEIAMDVGQAAYAEFLSSLPRFASAMDRLFVEWPISCEHFFTAVDLNRIAWIGQAATCIDSGLPRLFRGGFHSLTTEQQEAANLLAEEYVQAWEDRYAQKSGIVHSHLGTARLF